MDNPTLEDLHALLADARKEVFKSGYDAGFARAVELFRSFGDDAKPPAAHVAPGAPAAQPEAEPKARRFQPGGVAKLIKSFVYGANGAVTPAQFSARHPEVNPSSRHAAAAKLHELGVIVQEGGTWRRPENVGRFGSTFNRADAPADVNGGAKGRDVASAGVKEPSPAA